MRWNNENKQKVWDALHRRVRQMDLLAWNSFSETFGISTVYRGREIYSPSMMWMKEGSGPGWNYLDPWGKIYSPAASKKHIIVDDIFNRNSSRGHKIPKEVAEKFLVLGVP